MSVLLTGAKGFLGSILYKELQDKHSLVQMDLKGADINCDLSKDVPVIDEAVSAVIHCAGLAHVQQKTEDGKEFYDINHQGTVNLLSGLEKNPPRLFIFISSVSVYGLETGHLIPESSPLEGSTPYAKSKILAEQEVAKWCENNGVTYLIIRLPLLAGPNPPGNLGKMIGAIKRGRFFYIRGGQAKKSMLYAADIASLVNHDLKRSGIYNLTDGTHPSFRDLGTVIAERTGKSKPVAIPLVLSKFMAIVGDLLKVNVFNSLVHSKMAEDLTFDDSKAIKELNWRPNNVIERLSQESI